MMDLREALYVGAGIALIVAGIGVRLGRLRGWAKMYRTPGIPVILRHAPLTLIPGGLIPLGAVLVVRWPWGEAAASLRLVLAAGTALLPIAILLIAYRPPRFLKPDWLQKEESTLGHAAPTDRFDGLVLTALSVGVVILVIAVLLAAGGVLGAR